MESITLGQIGSLIIFLGSIIGGAIALIVYIKKALKIALKDDFDSIKDDMQNFENNITSEIKSIKQNLNDIDISNCKNFLVSCYGKLDVGHELDETEKERYYEMFDLYTNKYNQNSYIHAKHEKLKKEGKL